MPGNVNFDAMLSTTMAKYQKRLTDNIFTDRVLSWYLLENNRIRMENGGTKIVEPLIYAQNDTVGSYSGFDQVPLTPQEGITAAEFDWKQYAVSIAISGIDEAKNSGESAVLNLLEAKIMQAEESAKEGFNTMWFGDGTGNSSKDMNGLANLIDNTGTVGNIDSTAVGNTWWKSYKESTATALTQAIMTTGYNTVSKGNDHPDLILTSQALFEKYEGLLVGNLRYSDTKTAAAGFQNLMFKGAPVVFDAGCTAGVMYYLNSKYLGLVGLTGKWLQQTPFQRPDSQDARFSLILSYGNLTVRNRVRLGKLTAKT